MRVGGRGATTVVAAAAIAAAEAVPAVSWAAEPRVEQLVVYADGSARQGSASTAATTARVGRRTCGVGTATPLAALLRSRPGGVALRDYGACTRRAADSGGLYVYAVGGKRASGPRGWVYKEGNLAATAGAADPSGPVGRGRLRGGERITWYFCRLRASGCERNITVRARDGGGGVVAVRVRAYDDEARSTLVRGATVHVGSMRATTDSRGLAFVTAGAGRHRVHAVKAGLVRSFTEQVLVR